MRPAPFLSVVMPAHQAAHLLPETLGAMVASELPRDRWELIVVDDASRDATRAIAERFADRVLPLTGRPGGPGNARNAGAALAAGEWLVFLDADVRVHSDTLRRFTEVIARDPEIAAVFGAYDARPLAGGLVSQYRNLLHRYVHLQGAGAADTFWAGCGAVRRDWFEAVGGFDTTRYPRPQIEDIELGYRLRDRGGRIILDPSIQGTHLKAWTMWGVVKTDIRDRGVPWVRLLLERRGRRTRSLNIGRNEPVKVVLAGAALTGALTGLALTDLRPLAAIPVAALLLIAWNLDTYRWFARERGVGFAAAVVPLHLIHYAGNAIAAASGITIHVWGQLGRRVRGAARAS